MVFITFVVSISEFSCSLTISVFLVVFVLSFMFISRNMLYLRIHGAEDLMFPTSAPISQNSKLIPKIDMMKVHILFTFKLINSSSENNQINGIQCLISSKVKYCIQVLWGVNIRELHINLWHQWPFLQKAFFDGNLLKNQYQFKTIHDIKSAHDDEILTLKLPEMPLDLGLPPRLYYPLVVLLIRSDLDNCINPHETVALVNVIHVKDSICTLPTSVLSQYLKQANGQLSCLKQLYLATGNVMNYEKEENTINLSLAEPLDQNTGDFQKAFVCQSEEQKSQATWKNTSSDQLCVVCQYFPLSRALLPCRHTCLCAICFDKLDRCPLCRGAIKSYFCIRNEEYVPKSAENDDHLTNEQSSKTSRSIFHWLDQWNEVIVNFLGLPFR